MTVIIDDLPKRVSGLIILKEYTRPIHWVWQRSVDFKYCDIKRVL